MARTELYPSLKGPRAVAQLASLPYFWRANLDQTIEHWEPLCNHHGQRNATASARGFAPFGWLADSGSFTTRYVRPSRAKATLTNHQDYAQEMIPEAKAVL